MKFTNIRRGAAGVLGFLFALAPVPYMINQATITASAADVQSTLDQWAEDIEESYAYWMDKYLTAPAQESALYYPYVSACLAWKSSVELVSAEVALFNEDSSIPSGRAFFGWFYYNNQLYSGTLFLYGSTSGRQPISANVDRVVLFSSDLTSVYGSVTNTIPTNNMSVFSWIGSSGAPSFTGVFNSSGSNIRWGAIADTANIFTPISNLNQDYVNFRAPSPTTPTISSSNLSSYFYTGSSIVPIIGSLTGETYDYTVTVPDAPNTVSGVSSAIYDSLSVSFPKITEIWFEPDVTPEPIYPSEFVTGIPKEWTVENPQIPTADDIEFNNYEQDLNEFHPIQQIKETVDIVKAMDFWWWLTEKTMDALNLKIFYVIFLTIGVLIFICWVIGQ